MDKHSSEMFLREGERFEDFDLADRLFGSRCVCDRRTIEHLFEINE